jgi:hypothetical protein
MAGTFPSASLSTTLALSSSSLENVVESSTLTASGSGCPAPA